MDRKKREESSNWRSFDDLFSKLPVSIICPFFPGSLTLFY